MTDTVLIVDFGSQVTQLIARRVREAGVYSEIAPFNKAEEALARLKPKAVIFSGGPASVLDRDAPLPPMSVYERRRADPRHLLRRAGDGPPARRQGRGRAQPRIRPRLHRGRAPGGALRRRLEARRAPSGVDEPRRPGDEAARRLRGGRHLGRRAVRRDRRRAPQVLRDPVPPGGGPHAGRREAPGEFRPQGRRPEGRLDDGGVPPAGDRPHPRAGRQGPRHLRPCPAASTRRSPRSSCTRRSATSSPASSSITG